MYSQVDPDGHTSVILECILDFKNNYKALSKDDLYITTQSGRR